ncbi:MAG: aminotransferase class V-fold PLP-dependent enzyme, partial [Desulfurella sp.]|uniref:aminotransferase class V-fold PLP-dependent enzyme n=1 Tax=Desulfurella sp. TaxID=1962857 RepID=UPI003D0D747C
MQKKGFEIRYIGVNNEGLVNLNELNNLIDDNTILVSIQHVNQEIGTLQDIISIGEICKQKNCLYHCDATFSFPFFDIDLSKYNIDLLTIGSDTYYGPKGASALIAKNSIELEPLITGGYQEYNLRAGTQNIPAIVGMQKAIEIFDKKIYDYIKNLKDYFL